MGCCDCLDEEIDCVSELVAPAVFVLGLAKVDRPRIPAVRSLYARLVVKLKGEAFPFTAPATTAFESFDSSEGVFNFGP